MQDFEQDELDPWQEIFLDNRARMARENAERAKARTWYNVKLFGLMFLAMVVFIGAVSWAIYWWS